MRKKSIVNIISEYLVIIGMGGLLIVLLLQQCTSSITLIKGDRNNVDKEFDTRMDDIERGVDINIAEIDTIENDTL